MIHQVLPVKKFIVSLIVFLTLIPVLHSQNLRTISGSVIDSITGEILIGASLYIVETEKGVVSNSEGEYFFSLQGGNYTFKISYLGYKELILKLKINHDTIFHISLPPLTVKLNEVVVTKTIEDQSSRGMFSGMVELSGKELKMLPALLGEHDPIKLLQYLPGVKTVTEGDMGFYVRGGGPDQNLILLDNAIIYNPTHVLGYFSVFNEDITDNLKFYKSGIPANYGNKLSSVIDVHTVSGIPEKKSFQGSLGLISSKAMVGVPFLKNRGGMYLSFRKSYIDELVKPIVTKFMKSSNSVYNNAHYSFYDINFKTLYRIGDNDKIELSFYQGKDDFNMGKLSVEYKNKFFWGNRMASIYWTHYFRKNAYLVNTFYYTKYNFQFGASQSTAKINIYSGVDDLAYKLDFTKVTETGVKRKAGIDYQHHLFRPNNLDASLSDNDLNFSPNRRLYSHELSLYYTGEYSITSNFSTESGIRLTSFGYTGPYFKYRKDAFGEITDTIEYGKGDWLGTYYFAEPHLAFRYILNPVSSLKFSFQYNSQYIHLLSATAVTIPLDVWMPSYENLKPQKGWQVTLGYYKDIPDRSINAYVDSYFKEMYNQVELLHGIINSYSDNLFEESMVFGRGRSYGIEFFIQKNTGKLTGWIGYTLSRSEKQFPEIDSALVYPAKYDRRHDIKLVSSYQISPKWVFNASFVYSSGSAFTLPVQKSFFEWNIINVYGKTNSFRMPAYHRLDISFTYTAKKTEKYESVWIFSLFNVYNRQNPFFIFFEVTGDLEKKYLKTEAKQVSIFPIMPSIAWNFKF